MQHLEFVVVTLLATAAIAAVSMPWFFGSYFLRDLLKDFSLSVPEDYLENRDSRRRYRQAHEKIRSVINQIRHKFLDAVFAGLLLGFVVMAFVAWGALGGHFWGRAYGISSLVVALALVKISIKPAYRFFFEAVRRHAVAEV